MKMRILTRPTYASSHSAEFAGLGVALLPYRAVSSRSPARSIIPFDSVFFSPVLRHLSLCSLFYYASFPRYSWSPFLSSLVLFTSLPYLTDLLHLPFFPVRAHPPHASNMTRPMCSCPRLPTCFSSHSSFSFPCVIL